MTNDTTRDAAEGAGEAKKENWDCFWPRCSDSKRCREFGSRVALAQRKAITAGDFPRAATSKPAPDAMRKALDERQRVVIEWGERCFGADHMRNKIVRAARFFEEAAELVQAVGLPRDHAMRAFNHVYSRQAGNPAQEAGGVANTLMALCGALNLSFDGCQQVEIARCLAKDPAYFAARNEAKLREVDALSPPVPLTESCGCYFGQCRNSSLPNCREVLKAKRYAPVPPADGANVREIDRIRSKLKTLCSAKERCSCVEGNWQWYGANCAANMTQAMREVLVSPSGTGAAEPVAWQRRNIMRDGTRSDWMDCSEEHAKELREEYPDFAEVRPLYATPPVRGDREEIAAAMFAVEYNTEIYPFAGASSAERTLFLKMADAALFSLPVQPGAGEREVFRAEFLDALDFLEAAATIKNNSLNVPEIKIHNDQVAQKAELLRLVLSRQAPPSSSESSK